MVYYDGALFLFGGRNGLNYYSLFSFFSFLYSYLIVGSSSVSMNDLWAFTLNQREGVELHKWYWLDGTAFPGQAFSTPDVVSSSSVKNYPSGR